MSPTYDSNNNGKDKSFMQPTDTHVHTSLSQVNRVHEDLTTQLSLHFQHMTAEVLFHTHWIHFNKLQLVIINFNMTCEIPSNYCSARAKVQIVSSENTDAVNLSGLNKMLNPHDF